MHYSEVIQEQLIIDCYQSVTPCSISAGFSPPLMRTQRNNTAHRRSKSWGLWKHPSHHANQTGEYFNPKWILPSSTSSSSSSSSSTCIYHNLNRKASYCPIRNAKKQTSLLSLVCGSKQPLVTWMRGHGGLITLIIHEKSNEHIQRVARHPVCAALSVD